MLGLTPPPSQLLVPTQLKHLSRDVKNVCAGQYHSVAWGPHCLYTWGLNAGQLGHKMRTDDKYVAIPKAVKLINFEESEIKALDSSDGAIAFYTRKGDVYVLHEFQCRRIASRQLDIVELNCFGGKLYAGSNKDLKEPPRELKVIALTSTGNLLLWQEADAQLCRCIFTLNRPVIVKQMKLTSNGVIFVTRDGEAFQGTIKPRRKKLSTTSTSEKSAFHKFLDREDCISVKLSKISRVHRAIAITSDSNGHDFCVIQVPPYKRFSAPPIIESSMKEDLNLLLEECQENDDLHDVVFQIDNQYFPAHKFMMASKSTYFEKLLIDTKEIVRLQGFHPLIFRQFLTFVYTNDCELLRLGECHDKFKVLCEFYVKNKNKDSTEEAEIDGSKSAFEIYTKHKNTDENEARVKNPVRMLHEMAKKLGCNTLCNILANYEMIKFVIKKKSTKKDVVLRPIQFDRLAFSQFFDVTIKCFDDKEVNAHKCLLAARSDYFSNLFSSRWHGVSVIFLSLLLFFFLQRLCGFTTCGFVTVTVRTCDLFIVLSVTTVASGMVNSPFRTQWV